MFAPLTLPKEQGSYWLQVHQTASGGPSSQRGYLRFVAQMADLISDFFKSHRLRLLERDRVFLSLAERTLNDMSVASSVPRGLAKLMSVVRQHAGSEHAFLLHRSRKLARWRVVAAAGLIEIDRRATGIEQIEVAALSLHRKYPNGGVLTKENPRDASNPDSDELAGLMKLFVANEAAWIKCHDEENSQEFNTKQDVTLLVLWSGEASHPVHCTRQCGLLTKLGLTALQVPWWRDIRIMNQPATKSMTRVFTSVWSSRIKWGIGLVLLACVLAIPVPMRIHARAVLIPTVQQHVYAPWDSFVETILVDHGQQVTSGQPLLRLTSPALLAEFEAARSQQLKNAQRLSDIESRLLRETNLPPNQRDELEGEMNTISSIQEIDLRSISRMMRQIESLTVSAQFDGTVSTWNVHENLKDRPVRAGQWLLSIHQNDSQWMFEAALPEQYANEFQTAVSAGISETFATMTSVPNQRIQVHYNSSVAPYVDILSPSMDRHYSTMPINTEPSIIRLRFDVEDNAIPQSNATAGATARVSIPSGRGPLIWAFSKDFFRKAITQVKLWI